MKTIKMILAGAAAALTLTLGGKAPAQPQGFGGAAEKALAQPQGFGGGAGGGGGMNFQNMDPQAIMKQIQQRLNDSYREQMDVTNDTEWALIEERINAVTQARQATVSDGGGVGGLMGMAGMMGMGGRRGAGGGGGGGMGGGLRALLGTPSPESEALQQAIDANAPASQIKGLIGKLEASRKAKLAKLAQAQEDLRAVLSTRQEAIAIMGGLLD